MEMLFPGITSGVPGCRRLTFTPSPRQGTGPSSTPATTRKAMSVTSSLGRRPLGKPAGSGRNYARDAAESRVGGAASTVNRRWLAGAVGGCRDSAAAGRRRGRGPVNTGGKYEPRHRRDVGAAGSWEARAEYRVDEEGEPRVLVESRNRSSSLGSLAFHLSLEPVPMITSLTSGLASRATWTNSTMSSTFVVQQLPSVSGGWLKRNAHRRWKQRARNLDGDGGDVHPLEAIVDAEGVPCRSDPPHGENRRRPPVFSVSKVDLIDVEGLLALPTNTRMPRPRSNTPARPAGVVRHRRRPDVGGHCDQRPLVHIVALVPIALATA